MSPSSGASTTGVGNVPAMGGGGETVIRYCLGVDLRNWLMFENCFTDPVNTGYGSDAEPTRNAMPVTPTSSGSLSTGRSG